MTSPEEWPGVVERVWPPYSVLTIFSVYIFPPEGAIPVMMNTLGKIILHLRAHFPFACLPAVPHLFPSAPLIVFVWYFFDIHGRSRGLRISRTPGLFPFFCHLVLLLLYGHGLWVSLSIVNGRPPGFGWVHVERFLPPHFQGPRPPIFTFFFGAV